MIKCKLTGVEGKGIRSHIIPKSFITFQDNASVIINDKRRPKRTQRGQVDDCIVTQEGENILKSLDDYGRKLLQPNNFETVRDNKGNEVGRVSHSYDYHTFKLFCLSILWRMSVSSLEEFRGVNLGPHQEIVKNMILNKNA